MQLSHIIAYFIEAIKYIYNIFDFFSITFIYTEILSKILGKLLK